MRVFLLMVALVVAVEIPASAQVATPPERTDDNLIVASYNIKWLGQATHNYAKLTTVIQHFDVCGVLEVKNEDTLAELQAELESQTGTRWGYVFGVRTHRPHGLYHEAYGVLYRRDRVELGDGVVSNVWDLEETFRNDPFLVTFRRGTFDFTLLLIHTRWSDDEDGVSGRFKTGQCGSLHNRPR